MGTDIPPFGDAIRHLRGLLPDVGMSASGSLAELVWLTREDFYSVRFGWYYFTSRPACTPEMFNDYYEASRASGLVRVEALFCTPGVIGCTVWFPQSEAEAPQGWYSGARMSVRVPLGIGAEVRSDLRWKLHTLSPKYRRQQAFPCDIPTAAEVRNASLARMASARP
jgi:hypothetical protein